MKGKLIVVEGTDCSGKETQTNKLIDHLNNDGIKTVKYSFPNYDSPTGKIVGGPYLGKSYICDGWFKEGAPNVDAMVSCLYYAADRKYNIAPILEKIDEGKNVILDRYVYSNMAHQGGKIHSNEEQIKMFKWIERLEFDLLNLPKPDIKIFLHMPCEWSVKLRESRAEDADQNEASISHLIDAEKAFLNIAKLYDFYLIECVYNNELKTREQIHDEVYKHVLKKVK